METIRVTWDDENGCDPCCRSVEAIFANYELQVPNEGVFLAPAEAVFDCPHGASESAPGVLVTLPDLPPL